MNRNSKLFTIVGSIIIGIVSLLIVYLSLILTDVIVITQKDIVIQTNNGFKEYDGTALTQEGYVILEGTLDEGHKFKITYTGIQVNAGSSENTAKVKVISESGQDVTKNYNITVKPGVLTVGKRKICILSNSDSKTYDGLPLTKDGYTITTGTLVEGDSIIATTTGTITEVGVVDNKFDVVIKNAQGVNVDSNYEVEKTFGQLSIAKRIIELQSASDTKEYDGFPLSNAEYEFLNGSLAAGDQITVTNKTELTKVSKIENKFSVSVSNTLGKDVTKNYEIRYVNGTLEITKRTIKVKTGSTYKIYDGTKLEFFEYEVITTDKLLYGHTLELEMSSFLIEVGQIPNDYDSFTVKDSEGNDYTSCYELDVEYGTLTIHKKIITIITESASKYYDGDPLFCHEYAVAEATPLPDGYRMNVSFAGRITEPGEVENSVSNIVIYNQYNQNKTNNFDINLIYGTLVVYESGYVPPVEPPILDGPVSESEKTMLYVTSTKGGVIYLRDSSAGDYNGKGFNFGQVFQYDDSYPINPIYLASSVLDEKNYASNQVVIELTSAEQPYYYPYYGYNALEFTGNDIAIQVAHDKTYSVDYYSYSYNKNLLYKTSEYIEFEKAYREFVYETYLQIPTTTKIGLQLHIDEQGFTSTDPEIFEKVMEFIASKCKYNLSFESYPSNVDDVLYFLNNSQEGVCRHFAATATMFFRALGIPARYTTGYAAAVMANTRSAVKAKQAHAWVEIYVDGFGWIMLDPTTYAQDITPSEPEKETITATPKTVRLKYDGVTTLYAENIVNFSNLPKGYTYEAVVTGSQTEVGYGTSIIESLIIYNQDGEDVTDEFNIHLNKGVLHVYKEVLRITTVSASKEYDGTPLTQFGYDDPIGLLPNHVLYDVKMTSSITNVGRAYNYISFKVIDVTTGNDVTYMYYIQRNNGLLIVEPIEITVEIGSAEKVYDGTELICNTYKYYKTDDPESNGLLPGHYIKVTITDSITNIGIAENTVDQITITYNGRNVLNNYRITIINGTLKINPE